jgi:hypothetical protein
VGWNLNDLTARTGAPRAISQPTAYLFAGQNTQHVVYTSVDHHVLELWWSP